jgi:hypothetical protein
VGHNKIAVYLCLTSFLLPLDILSRGFFALEGKFQIWRYQN